MNNNEVVDLCILGRDRIYQDLIEIEKVIKFCEENNYNYVLLMLKFKESEITQKKDNATKIINTLKGVKE